MLFFIRNGIFLPAQCQLFKYISCYSLSPRSWGSSTWCPYSNTSHVILYPIAFNDFGISFQFKYISCYSLSVYPIGQVLYFNDSNTSHVILYLKMTVAEALAKLVFKYISCYSLSKVLRTRKYDFWIQIHLMLFFIVLPRLSKPFLYAHSNTSHVILYLCSEIGLIDDDLNSNTSHVILYHIPASMEYIWMSYSNTSHVILYPCRRNGWERNLSNSNTSHVILYQLLRLSRKVGLKFKYISCYSLSNAFPPFPTLLYFKPPHISIFYHFLPTVTVFQPNSLLLPHIPCIFRILLLFLQFAAW